MHDDEELQSRLSKLAVPNSQRNRLYLKLGGGCFEATEFDERKRNGGKERRLRGQGELALRNVTLSPLQSFFEINWTRAGVRDLEMYFLFTFAIA